MGEDKSRLFHTVRVVKHLPLGLSIELENGKRGIVRIRELSWDAGIRNNWHTAFPVGWTGKAVPIESRGGQYREFSLRLTEYDPWETLAAENQQGKIYDGIVTGVVTYGAFIELESNLTGLLHQSQLPPWATRPPLELFWPGDRVQVVVHEIDMERRRISLALPPVTTTLDENNPELPAIHRPQRYTTGLADLDEFLRSARKHFHILLVEDEEEQSWSVATWLRRLGQRVDVAATPTQALQFLETQQPDLALVDVGLPDMDGVELGHRLLDAYPDMRIISATDWARADKMTDALNALRDRGVELLMKPLLPEDLLRVLNQEKPQTSEVRKLESDTRTSMPALASAARQKVSRAVRSLLQQVRKRLGFEMAILFTLDVNNRNVNIADMAGEATLARHVIPSLAYSPVRDVAEDGIPVTTGEIGLGEHNRYKYLLELYPNLTSCIGLPVPVQSKLKYALFLLDRHPKSIPEEHRVFAEAIALALGSVLERNLLRESSIVIQRTALIGHLTSALVHEINNLISPLYTRVDGIRRNVEFLEKRDDPPSVQLTRVQQVSSELENAQLNIKRMVDTARMFRNIIRKSDEGIIRVDEIIKETLNLLNDTSESAQVNLYFTPPPSLVIVRGYAGAFEQVLLNVLLNAVQQVAALRPKLGGWVHIWIDKDPADAPEGFFQILVEDNGPGIHTSLWETIFEAGYTTREDGSGIGLYISRSMVEETGGRLFVRESRILGGTTFALEIPRHHV